MAYDITASCVQDDAFKSLASMEHVQSFDENGGTLRSDVTSSQVIIPRGAVATGTFLKLRCSTNFDFSNIVAGLSSKGYGDVDTVTFVAPLMHYHVDEGDKQFAKPVTIVIHAIQCDMSSIEVYVAHRNDAADIKRVPRKSRDPREDGDTHFYTCDEDNTVRIETIHFCWYTCLIPRCIGKGPRKQQLYCSLFGYIKPVARRVYVDLDLCLQLRTELDQHEDCKKVLTDQHYEIIISKIPLENDAL